MQQTLLAILAMMIAVTFSYSTQVRYVDVQRTTMAGEMREMGSAVAVEMIELLRERAYDAWLVSNDTDGMTSSQIISSFELKDPTDHFSGGLGCDVLDAGSDACEAVEHFHNMETAQVPFVISVDTFYFDVDIRVRYVDEMGQPASNRTASKEVTVLVRDTWPSGLEPLLREPIQLSRVFTYQMPSLN